MHPELLILHDKERGNRVHRNFGLEMDFEAAWHDQLVLCSREQPGWKTVL